MVENSEVLTREAISAGAIEQTWIFEVGGTTGVGRTIPKLANIFVGIVNWLDHLGGGKIDENRMEARHCIHHNVKTNGIRF